VRQTDGGKRVLELGLVFACLCVCVFVCLCVCVFVCLCDLRSTLTRELREGECDLWTRGGRSEEMERWKEASAFESVDDTI
jgi:hypothetical protein